ncbi:hypothetical protein C7N83_06315 [Neisseria iguanae]|uniref:Uncharacterized protein n=1 Tax=Neisseria iguanae TaxID=90242 RepID=A0A2P7U095_9NEIS|nr:hypothetical protein C7N83_06315 [Neisseria iguanae]
MPQHFKLPGRCAEVKAEPAFFQRQRERFTANPIVFAQDALRPVPTISNAADRVLTVCKKL